MMRFDDPVRLDDLEFNLGNLTASTGFLTRVVNIQINDYTRLARDSSTTSATLAFLALVAANPGIRQNHAGRLLLVHQPNIAALVKKLTEQGLITTASNSSKRSGVWITEQGAALLERDAPSADPIGECSDILSDKEHHQLVDLLNRLYRSRL